MESDYMTRSKSVGDMIRERLDKKNNIYGGCPYVAKIYRFWDSDNDLFVEIIKDAKYACGYASLMIDEIGHIKEPLTGIEAESIIRQADKRNGIRPPNSLKWEVEI